MHHVREQRERLEVVVNDDRLEDVELKVAIAGAHGHGGVIAHYLGSNHGDGFALRGIHLARHDGGARLILGEAQLTQTAAGTTRKEAGTESERTKKV